MAASDVDVANGALVKIGINTLTSLSDNSKEGRLCNLRYYYNRDMLLRSHPWNFAKKRVSLAVSATVPEYYWEYQFPLPSDLLKLLDNDLNDNDEWVLEGGNFLCHVNVLNILYIFRQTDPTQFDPSFQEALEWKLATDLAYSLVQSVSLAENCYKAYLDALKLARSMNAQERGSVQQVIADDWSTARLTSGSFGFGQDPSKL